jgi:hypothetical protein
MPRVFKLKCTLVALIVLAMTGYCERDIARDDNEGAANQNYAINRTSTGKWRGLRHKRPKTTLLSSHFGGSSSDGIDSSSSSDGDPWRNSPKTKAFCSELDQTTPLDSQLFLFEFLRVFCLGRELILNRPDAYIRSARLKEALGDRFILTGKAHPIKFWQIKDQVCNLSQLVRKQQSFASSSQVQLTATVLRSSCSLCNLTRGFRENKHRINEPRYGSLQLWQIV